MNLLDKINEYIYTEMKTKTLAFKKIEKLVTFIKENNLPFNIDICVKLFEENSFFNDLVGQEIKKIPSEQPIFSVIYDSYCLINNIETDDLIYEEDIDIVSSSFQQYMNEITSYPLLTKEEEKLLGMKIKSGDEQAKTTFIKHNLRLVVFVAKKYAFTKVDIMDLIQDGNIGLIKAVNKFDWNKGYKFSTYATWWIKQTITRGIANKSRVIRIPVYYNENMMLYQKFLSDFTQINGRMPTEEEIVKYSKLTIKDINTLKRYNYDIVSFNQRLTSDSEDELGDFIIDNNDDLDEIIINKDLQNQLRKFLKDINLNEKEMKIISLRYGLWDGKIYTLDQIASFYGVTKERIRQLESKILRKMRTHKLVNNLASFTDNETRSKQNIVLFKEGYAKNNLNFNKKQLDKSLSLSEFLNIDSPQHLNNVLEKLFPEELILLSKRYASDSLKQNSWTDEEANIYLKYLIPYLKRLAKNPNYKRKTIPIWLKINYQNNLSLTSILNKDMASIRLMLTKLYPEELSLVIKRYGHNLCNLNEIGFSLSERYVFFKYVIPTMKDLLNNPNLIREKPPWLLGETLLDQVLYLKLANKSLAEIASILNISLENVANIFQKHYQQCLEFFEGSKLNPEITYQPKLSRK